MPHFIADTTVTFEIQLRRLTRSAVLPVFALFFHSKARANCATTTKIGMPDFIANTTVEFEIQLHRRNPKCCLYLFLHVSSRFPTVFPF